MFDKFTKLVLIVAVSATLGACDKDEKTYEGSPDAVRLTRSFSHEDPEMKQYIADVITEANALNYSDAMNKLSILAATKKVTKQQKNAIDLMVKQLRYDMEEKIFREQGRPK